MGSHNEQPCFFLDSVTEPEGASVLFVEILTCVLNSILAVTATAGNVVVIFVIWKTPSLHCPSNVLICCLALSDLVIGMVAQPSFVSYKIAEMHHNTNVACYGRIVHWVTGFLCAGVSLMTITAIAVDKLLAVQLHLRYNVIVTVSRVCKVVVVFWTFCSFVMGSLFVIDSDRYWSLVPAPVALISLATTVIAYMKIFQILKRHKKQIRDQEEASSFQLHGGLTIKKYKNSTMTTLYILMLFLLCYLPLLVSMVCRIVQGYTAEIKIAYEIGASLIYVNSSLNPILYCLRMTEIRKAALRMLRRQNENSNFQMVHSAARRSNARASSDVSQFNAEKPRNSIAPAAFLTVHRA